MVLNDLAGVFFILMLCGVLINLVWHSVRLGMTPAPSLRKAIRAVNSLLAAHHRAAGRVIDLGSGWGTLVIALARKHPDIQFIGYEYSLLPMLWPRIVCRLKHVRSWPPLREIRLNDTFDTRVSFYSTGQQRIRR